MIHLLGMSLAGLDADDAQWQRLVSPGRWAYIQQRRRPEARAQSVGAMLLLRHALAAYFPGVPLPAAVDMDGNGKPRLQDAPDIHVNWSHSGDAAVCAIGRVPLGVDVEKVKHAPLDVADRFFAEEEKSRLHALPAEEQARAFTELWTLKESHAKALGLGIYDGLSRMAIPMANGVPQPVEHDGRRWHFHLYPSMPGYCMALCAAESAELPEHLEEIPLSAFRSASTQS